MQLLLTAPAAVILGFLHMLPSRQPQRPTYQEGSPTDRWCQPQTQIGPTTHSLAHVERLCINSPDHTNQFPALALRSPLQILIQQQADILAGCQRQHEPSKALPAHESETDGLGAASSAVSNVVPVELSLASRKQWVFSIH